MKGKVITILIILILFSTASFGQKEISEDTPYTFKERAYAGIGFGGLSFGNHTYYGRYFSIGAGVLGGYMLTRNLSAGVGFEYQYTSYSDQKFRNHVYGGYPFVRYNIKNFFVQFDYDLYWLKANIPNASAEAQQERFFGGIGFSSASRGRAFMNFLVSYDFLYTSQSLFGSPLNTRLFFTF
jgi:hypothetical protein